VLQRAAIDGEDVVLAEVTQLFPGGFARKVDAYHACQYQRVGKAMSNMKIYRQSSDRSDAARMAIGFATFIDEVPHSPRSVERMAGRSAVNVADLPRHASSIFLRGVIELPAW
jgi:hypothetical protein